MGINPIRVAILGGGLAGCVLARRIGAMRHIEVDLLERRSRLGGSHASTAIDGALFDSSATLFGLHHPLFAMFPGLAERFVEVEHHPRILSPSGAIDDSPPTPESYIVRHGARATARAALDLLAAKARHRPRASVPEFVRYYLGETLYRQSGLREYLERLFVVPERELDLAFASDRLIALAESASVGRNLVAMLRRAVGHGGDPEPWRCYVRPREGFDVVYRHIAEDLRLEGVTVRLGATVEAIERVGGGFDVTAGGRTRRYDRIISTLPTQTTATAMGIAAQAGASPIEHASLVTLFYRLRGGIAEPGQFFYNFTRHGRWRRIVVLSRYYGRVDGEHYFIVEGVRQSVDRESLEEVAWDFERQLPTLRFLDGVARRVGGVVLENHWPLARIGQYERIAALERSIRSRGVDLAGPQGTLRYRSSQEMVDSTQRLVARLDLRGDGDDDSRHGDHGSMPHGAADADARVLRLARGGA